MAGKKPSLSDDFPARLDPEDAEIVAKHRRERRDAQAENFVMPCPKHPNWRVDVSRGQPTPVWPSCPLCSEETRAARDDQWRPVRELDPGTASQKMDGRYLAWLERNQPDALEEDAALTAILTAREEEKSREAKSRSGMPPGSRLVSARSEENIWREYWAVPGRGIVKRSAAA